MNKKLIITHKNCVDGCCSQAIFKTKYPDDIYLELDHVNLDETKDDNAKSTIDYILGFKNSTVYVADFCLPKEMIQNLLDSGNKVVILDHHESNIKQVEPFVQRIRNGETLNLEINFSYDNTKSGTMLSWEYLYPNIEPPLSVKHVSNGDTWKFELGVRTKHFYSGIMKGYNEPNSVPKDTWIEIITEQNSGLKYEQIGEPLYSKFQKEIQEIGDKSTKITINNKPGMMVMADRKYTSDVGNYLAQKSGGFGLVYFIEESGIVRCSLRSIHPVTVNDIAESLGGGGHAQAAAFRCKNIEEFNSIIDSTPTKKLKI